MRDSRVFFPHLRRALQNIRRSPRVFWSSVGTIGLAYFVLFILITLASNFFEIARNFDQNMIGVAFLEVQSEAEAIQIEKQIQGLSASLTTQRVAPDLDLATESNAMPWALVIKSGVGDVALQESFLSQIKQLKAVEEVVRPSQEITRAKWWVGVLLSGSFLVSMLLAILVVVVVMNSVKLSVVARQSEVDIMRLVGATERFVRAPFLLEGMLHGLCGVALAFGLLLVFHALFPGDATQGFSLHFLPVWAICLWPLSACGFGALGALWSA